MTTANYHIFSPHLASYEQQLDDIFSALRAQPPLLAAQTQRRGRPLPEKSYFVCFINRSGSNLLAEALAKTRRMGRPGEIFNVEPVRSICGANNLRSMSDYIEWHLRNTTLGQVFGAKVGMQQLAYLAKEKLLERFPSPRFVYVTRKDILMQAVSLHIAWQTGAWTSKISSDKMPEFDADAIACQLRGIAEAQAGFEAFFAAHGIEPLRLNYEMIESEPEKAMRQVCRFVGIKNVGQIPFAAASLKKQRTSLNVEWAERFRRMYVSPGVSAPVSEPHRSVVSEAPSNSG